MVLYLQWLPNETQEKICTTLHALFMSASNDNIGVDRFGYAITAHIWCFDAVHRASPTMNTLFGYCKANVAWLAVVWPLIYTLDTRQPQTYAPDEGLLDMATVKQSGLEVEVHLRMCLGPTHDVA